MTPDTPALRRDAPELLAPAGDPMALRAAVANGADAVYLGADRFNARRSAGNFTMDELAEATRYAHLRGVRVYLTANILVLPHEMQDALTLVDEAWSAGVDAVIVQDLGLLSQIREHLPDARIHASTQMGVHESATARWLGSMGVSRVTLARETSLGQIGKLSAAAGIEVESFVHGALCFCYSGQCLMSSVIGGRSGNRGMCAQPCRLRYDLIDAEGSARDVPGRYLLSPKDLAGVEVLPQLVAQGVSALKIEGRMKSPEYVALVTGVYRKALDRAVSDPDAYAVTRGERDTLLEAFTRGFSTAYLEGIDDDRMMSYTRPNNRGVLVGRLKDVSDEGAVLALERSLDAEDTIEVWTRRGRSTQPVGEMRHRGNLIRQAPAGEEVLLSIDGEVAAGDRVFRVVNASLQTAARRTFTNDERSPRIPVDTAVRVVVGEPLRIEVTAKGFSASAEGPEVERARTKSLTAEEVMEHVGRMGSTPFSPHGWDIELQPGAGMGFSVLHKARRKALEDLEERMLESWAGRGTLVPATTPLARSVSKSSTGRPVLAVRVTDSRMVQTCLEAGADEVHVPLDFVSGALDLSDSRIVLELPRVVPDTVVEQVLDGATEGTRVLATTPGLLAEASSRGAEVDAHWGLNVTNPWSAERLSRMGARRIWLSPELRAQQIAETVAGASAPCGVAVYGRQELMVTQHCVLSVGGCDRNCISCERRRGWSLLRDEKGYEFPVTSDRYGRSHLANSVPLDVTSSMGEILGTGVSALRVDLTTETADEAQAAIARVRDAVEAAVAGLPAGDRVPDSTTGHFFRGVQ